MENKILSKHKPKPIYEKNNNITELAIDSHAHLDRFENAEEIILNAKKEGLENIILIAGSPESIQKAREYAKKYDNIYYAIALHPYDIHMLSSDYIKMVEDIARVDKKFVLVAEFGIDYHGDMPHTKEEQKVAFIKQLELADKLKKPVALHIRDAHTDAIKILKANKHLLNSGGIIHCYSGGKMEAQEYLSLGFHLSFSGSVTYHKDGCETEVIEALKITPPELMLIETDCPFLAPSPYRGNINEPKYVLVTAEHIADLLEKDVNEVIKQTRINTKKLLNLK